jgi:hypothetical protein
VNLNRDGKASHYPRVVYNSQARNFFVLWNNGSEPENDMAKRNDAPKNFEIIKKLEIKTMSSQVLTILNFETDSASIPFNSSSSSSIKAKETRDN